MDSSIAKALRASASYLIAAQAGVTKRTLYDHFASKDDLLAAVLDFHRELALKRIREWSAPLSGDRDAIRSTCYFRSWRIGPRSDHGPVPGSRVWPWSSPTCLDIRRVLSRAGTRRKWKDGLQTSSPAAGLAQPASALERSCCCWRARCRSCLFMATQALRKQPQRRQSGWCTA